MFFSILLAALQAFPSIANIVGMIFSSGILGGPSDAQIQTYQDMVNKQNESGNLSVEDHDKLLAHQAAIEARQAAKAAAAAKAKTPPSIPHV